MNAKSYSINLTSKYFNSKLVLIYIVVTLIEENGTKTCNLEYLNYNDSTIFHHNFSKTNLDSTEGYFLNKRYRAIKVSFFFA